MRVWLAALIAATGLLAGPALAEAPCPAPGQPIATDRPDVTNSSLVVPAGSLQVENGINLTSDGRDKTFDGTDSRLRFGVAQCLEILIDLPTRYYAWRGDATGGYSNIAPAVKWQISPDPGKFDLSAVFGIGFPTGTTAINGPGAQPYLQFPWSRELAGGWGISGMLTFFERPSDSTSRLTTETTFVLAKDIGHDIDVFTEYVGDFPESGRSRQYINSGASWKPTPDQSLDFHVAFGLDPGAADMIVGVGYSLRRDGMFKSLW